LNKNKKVTSQQQHGGITDKHDKNAGSSAFNSGSEQDPAFNEGTKVSDEEKITGHAPFPAGKETKNGGNSTEKDDKQ
jgi:hypothetical protein